MLRERIIPCLLLKGSGFVKTKRFSRPRYIGDAINALRIFNDKAADEIIILDIEASIKRFGPRIELIKQLTGELFMPLTYGGGISSMEHVKAVISCGVEKVSINSRNAQDLKLINQAAKHLGEQSVVGVVDVDKGLLGKKRVVCRGGKRKISGSPAEHARGLAEAGAGEILLQAVYLDGIKTGYDLDLIQEVRAAVDVPVIALGGAGSLEDMARAILVGGAAAAAAGSIFVYHGDLDGILINMPEERERTQAFRRVLREQNQK
jgi:cyclase